MKFQLDGVKKLYRDLTLIKAEIAEAQKEGLERLGELAVIDLKTRILGNEVKPPKLHDDGQPTLVDSGKYVNSYDIVEVNAKSVLIDAVGDNDHMSNHDLGELLEKDRPHQALTGIWAEDNGPAIVGDVVGKKLFERLT